MGQTYDVGSNVVDVYVRYLREKIDRPFGGAPCRRCAAWATDSRRRVDEGLAPADGRCALRVALAFPGDGESR